LKKRGAFKVWVLHSIQKLRDGDGPADLEGHIFLDEREANSWVNQEYVRGHYRIEERTAHEVRCPCGHTRVVLEPRA